MNQTERAMAVDRVVETLASARRRRILRHLLKGSETWYDREELARRLHSGRSDIATLETVLVHHHLPKLAEAGLIEYDHRSGAVRPSGAIEDLEPLLAACRELEAVWD